RHTRFSRDWSSDVCSSDLFANRLDAAAGVWSFILMSFDSLGLSAPIVRALVQQGYAAPTPIQAQVIPAALEGRDVIACARTGTGKTAAFTLPLLERLAAASTAGAAAGRGPRRVRALVLSPTRELAAQIEQSVRAYGAHLPLR